MSQKQDLKVPIGISSRKADSQFIAQFMVGFSVSKRAQRIVLIRNYHILNTSSVWHIYVYHHGLSKEILYGDYFQFANNLRLG